MSFMPGKSCTYMREGTTALPMPFVKPNGSKNLGGNSVGGGTGREGGEVFDALGCVADI
jgi:hypothetical protein